MIIGYVGTPGSGKSYEAVIKILDNLKTGRVVFTNIDGIDGEKQREHIKLKTGLSDSQLSEQLHYMTDSETDHFWTLLEGYEGALIVLDEVHKKFNNRDWASQKNKDFCDWASTHRHGGFDVLLITQDIEKIDKHARSLIEWTYFYRKINHFGKLVNLKYKRYAYDDDNHHGKPVADETLTYDKTIFPCYSSYDSSSVKELGIQKNVNLLKHPIFYAIPVVLIAFVYFLSQSSLFSGNILGSNAFADSSVEVEPATKTLQKVNVTTKETIGPGLKLVKLSTSTIYTNGKPRVVIFYQDTYYEFKEFPHEIKSTQAGLFAYLPSDKEENI